MLPSSVIVEATIRSAKSERAERPAHALPSAPSANPPSDSKRLTRTLEPINRRVIEPASLPSHRATSVVSEEYLSQNRISNRNRPKNRTRRKQTIKPSLTETRIAFLPGSASQVECDVTYSKQTTGRFLPGATTACLQSAKRVSRQLCSALSNRELPMRRASASRASAPWRATRGICFAFSNRELDLLEHHLNHRKQTTATRSNRELSTIQNSAFHQLQTASSEPPAVARSLNLNRNLNPRITDCTESVPLSPNFLRAIPRDSSAESEPACR